VTFYYKPTENHAYANGVGALQDNFNRVFFAGSERASRGFNWMEGAALSGRVTALNVLRTFYGNTWTPADDKAYTV
jgi:monoamine oxidase